MSAISAVAGSTGWAAQINQTAAKTAKAIGHHGNHDANKPQKAVETAKHAGAGTSKLNIKA